MKQELNFKAFSEFGSVGALQKLEQDFHYLDSPQDRQNSSKGVVSSNLTSSEDISFKFSYPSKKKGFAESLVEGLK